MVGIGSHHGTFPTLFRAHRKKSVTLASTDGIANLMTDYNTILLLDLAIIPNRQPSSRATIEPKYFLFTHLPNQTANQTAMCKNDETKQALPRPMTSISNKQGTRKKHQYGNRGSWLRFITSSFHGVLGSFSLLVTLSAWISNEYYESTSKLPLALTLLSVFTTTVLSIHSSWYMLEQSPHQSTILDWQLRRTAANAKENTTDYSVSPSRENSLRIRVVAPHRGGLSSNKYHYAVRQFPNSIAPSSKTLVRSIGIYYFHEFSRFVGFGICYVPPYASGRKNAVIHAFRTTQGCHHNQTKDNFFHG